MRNKLRDETEAALAEALLARCESYRLCESLQRIIDACDAGRENWADPVRMRSSIAQAALIEGRHVGHMRSLVASLTDGAGGCVMEPVRAFWWVRLRRWAIRFWTPPRDEQIETCRGTP